MKIVVLDGPTLNPGDLSWDAATEKFGGSLLWVIISLLGATLTLAGLVGIVVSIGVSLDSNVVFYEHLKEDVLNGQSLRLAGEKLPVGVLHDRQGRHLQPDRCGGAVLPHRRRRAGLRLLPRRGGRTPTWWPATSSCALRWRCSPVPSWPTGVQRRAGALHPGRTGRRARPGVPLVPETEPTPAMATSDRGTL